MKEQSEMAASVTKPAIANGIDVDQLIATIDAIKANPHLARLTFRAGTTWSSNGNSQVKIERLWGSDVEISSTALGGDGSPSLFAAQVNPHAAETVLVALSSCLAMELRCKAALSGIEVEHLEVHLEGEIDLHGFWGLSNRARPGYQGIRLSYRVTSDAPRRKVEELWEHVQKTSPLLDIIRNPVPVTLEMESEN
jgi:uncharacterized OsmC-like protein